MSVVVIGATGHIGGNLVRALVQQKRDVIAFARSSFSALDPQPVRMIVGNVLDADAVEKAVAGAEVVYNLAAKVSLEDGEAAEILQTNVEGPRNVVRACLKAKVKRLVHFSSIHAFSPFPLEAVVDETRGHNIGPEAFAYDRSKALGEQEVIAGIKQGLDAVIVNPTGVLGPYDCGTSNQGQALRDLNDGKVPALVVGGFNWVDVRDVVDAAIAAETRGRRGERYLLAGHWKSVTDVRRMIEACTGVRSSRVVLPLGLAIIGLPFVRLWARLVGGKPIYNEQMLAPLRQYQRIENAKAVRELGFHPRPIEETIADMFAWYAKCGMLEKPPVRPLALPAPAQLT